MQLSDYLDAAEKAPGITTQVALARALGVTRQSIISWRVGLSTPRPETMLRLAELAQVAPQVALLDHMAWHANGPASRDIVAQLRASIVAAAAAIFLCVLIFPVSPVAETCSQNSPDCVYYGKFSLWKSLCIELLSAVLKYPAPR